MEGPLGSITRRACERRVAMIAKPQITRRASDENVPARTVERDYILAHVTAAVSGLEDDSTLVFKGGTALRLCHFQNFRYSADLDFSVVGGTAADGLLLIEQALGTYSEATDFQLSLTNDSPPRIAYTGPLGRRRTVKLDLADDEYVVHTERAPLLSRWPDLPTGATVHVYSLLEVTAEKLRCVLQRLQCRDLFDLHVLFEAGVDAQDAAHLFEPKARRRGFDPNTFAERYNQRILEYERRWAAELSEHVPGEVPHFIDRQRAVARHLRRAGLI